MRVLIFLLMGIFAAAGAGMAMEDEQLSIYFVDVGQGSATLLHQPGKCSMLIDAGPAEQGESLRSVLAQAEIDTLDYMVVTHPHPDHYVGLQIILSDIVINELSDNGDQGLAEDGFDDYRQLRSELPYSVLAAGDSWQCGDLDIDVLHPPASFSGNANARSMVLRISYDEFRLLIMGDLAGSGEQALLATDEDLQAMVLQVAHHGAADATSAELLARVQPQIAIISVGAENDIGAPAEDVLHRLSNQAQHTLRTDLQGTVRLRVAANGNIRVSQ